MSLGLYVYSEEPVLNREKLARECLFPELPVRLQWEVRFLTEAGDLISSGAVSEGTLVAWHPDSPYDRQIREALSSQEQSGLEKLSAENAVGSSYLSVITPDHSEEWEDVMESVKEDVEDSTHKKYLRKVRTVYILETSATRNALSLEF